MKILKSMILMGLFWFGFASVVKAQSNYFSTSVFNNKLQFNPSQAGINNNLNFNLVIKTPLDNSQSGLSKEYAFCMDMPITESAAVGLAFFKENSGMLKHTLFNFDYAYGISLKKNLQVRFGIGAGFKNIRAEANSLNLGIVGDQGDPTLMSYNSIPPSFYSCFSVTVYTEQLEFQAAAPNLTAKLQNKSLQTLDNAVVQAGLTYKKQIGGGRLLNKDSYLKLFAGMMQYSQTGSIITGGILLDANQFMSANLQYSSSGIITAGIGIPIEKVLQVNVNYSVGGLYSKTIYGGSGVTEVHINYHFKMK